MNKRIFYDLYWKLQSLIVPGLKSSQLIYEDILNEHCTENIRWLDLGCGHHVLPTWRLKQEKELVNNVQLIVGIDYDYLSLTKHQTVKKKVRGSITKLPFSEKSFNLVTSNMVFEHLDDPEKQLKEISRVLCDDGILIFHTPNKLGYSTILARMVPEFLTKKLVYILQSRKEEDVFPTYYRINSPSIIKKLSDNSGFRDLKIKMICSYALFVILPPIVFFELLWIKFLMTKPVKVMRPYIIAILKK